jgi:hypothetical protein
MKFLIDFNGDYSELRANVESIGARVMPTHPLRYAALALEAQATSTLYHQTPGDYLRRLAEEDGDETRLLCHAKKSLHTP